MAERENKYECPNCHSEYIQRFEVVYEGGMSDLSLTTFGVGLGDDLGVGVGGSGGISQTVFRQAFFPIFVIPHPHCHHRKFPTFSSPCQDTDSTTASCRIRACSIR